MHTEYQQLGFPNAKTGAVPSMETGTQMRRQGLGYPTCVMRTWTSLKLWWNSKRQLLVNPHKTAVALEALKQRPASFVFLWGFKDCHVLFKSCKTWSTFISEGNSTFGESTPFKCWGNLVNFHSEANSTFGENTPLSTLELGQFLLQNQIQILVRAPL